MFKKSLYIISEFGFRNFFSRAFKYFSFLIKKITGYFFKYLSIRLFGFNHKLILKKIISNNTNRKIIVFHSSLDWNYPMRQRSRHLSEGFTSAGWLVFYCQDNFISCFIRGFSEVKNSCYVTYNRNILINKDIKAVHVFNSFDIEAYYPLVLESLENKTNVIYDYLDELHQDINQGKITKETLEKHRNILQNEYIFVLAVSEKLFNEAAGYRNGKNLVLIPNGVNFEHFANNNKQEIPKEFQEIMEEGKKIIGYYGTLAKWLDYSLIRYLSQNKPEYNIVLIGLIGDNEIWDYHFDELPNVKILKPVQYHLLPSVASKFDAGIIPFVINDVTNSAFPLKLFEYMAMGVPVVSTAIAECRKYEEVLVAANPEEFIEKTDIALTLKVNKDFTHKIVAIAKENNWETRITEIVYALLS